MNISSALIKHQEITKVQPGKMMLDISHRTCLAAFFVIIFLICMEFLRGASGLSIRVALNKLNP